MSSQVAFGGRELLHWPRLERGGDGLPIILARLGLSATGQLTAARCPAAAGGSAAAGRGATCCVGSPQPGEFTPSCHVTNNESPGAGDHSDSS